jgi:hypothetical protein
MSLQGIIRRGASGPRLTGTLDRDVLSWQSSAGEWVSRSLPGVLWPGAPVYDVRDFGAVGDGVADDRAAINAAIAAANLVPGTIYLGRAHRITGSLTSITGNNITVQGRGEFNGGSRIIVDSTSSIDVFTFLNGQYGGLNDVWIVGLRVYSAGWGITLNGCFRTRVNRCVISEVAFGVRALNSNGCYVDKVTTTNLWGVFNFFAAGTGGVNFNHALTFRTCIAGTNYPGAIVGNAGPWVALTAYVVGNVVVNAGGIYQCVVAGTSAGAGGPTGIPSTDPATAHTVRIVDGTAQWVFAMPAFVGFLQGSYAQTFEVIDCGVLQGLFGFSMEDTSPGAGSEPIFARFMNFQVDHTLERGIRLVAGGSARFHQTLVTSIFGGTGIEIANGFDGNWEFVGGEVFGCADAGMVIARGDGALIGVQMGVCSGRVANTRDCVEVSNSAAQWTVANCSLGEMFSGRPATSRYGISIAAGCDNYTVQNNRLIGNLTAPFLNTPGASATRVVRGNVPAQQAVISVAVPVVAAGTLAYLDVSTVGTTLAGITTADTVVGAPPSDLVAAGAGNGGYVGCRVSAANTIRLAFQGTLGGGAVNFNFVKVN